MLREHGEVAVTRDGAGGAPELDGDDDQADEPEDEHDEAADHDDGGEESALVDEVEEEEDEEEGQGGDGYEVGEVPGFIITSVSVWTAA